MSHSQGGGAEPHTASTLPARMQHASNSEDVRQLLCTFILDILCHAVTVCTAGLAGEPAGMAGEREGKGSASAAAARSLPSCTSLRHPILLLGCQGFCMVYGYQFAWPRACCSPSPWPCMSGAWVNCMHKHSHAQTGASAHSCPVNKFAHPNGAHSSGLRCSAATKAPQPLISSTTSRIDMVMCWRGPLLCLPDPEWMQSPAPICHKCITGRYDQDVLPAQKERKLLVE